MRKYLLTIGIFLFCSINAAGQNNKNFIVKANWNKSDVKEISVVRSISWQMNDEIDSFPVDTIQKYSISIINRSANGYIVEWKILNNIEDLGDSEFLKDYLKQFKYMIRTDENGSFHKLLNWKALVKATQKFYNSFISEVKKEKINQDILDSLFAQYKLPETKKEIITMCKGITDIFHGIYGVELPLNDSVFEQTTIPNEYIKEGIPALLKTETKELDDNIISIRYEYIYDNEKLKELQKKYFPEQEYSEQKAQFYTEYFYNSQTGWIEKIIIVNESESLEGSNKINIEYLIK